MVDMSKHRLCQKVYRVEEILRTGYNQRDCCVSGDVSLAQLASDFQMHCQTFYL